MHADEGVRDHRGSGVTGSRPVDPDAVARARSAALPESELEAATALFRLVGDPTRARLLYALRAAGELCVSDLATVTQLQESTCSQALRLLRAAGVVATRRDGRLVRYRLADHHVDRLLDLMHEHVDHEVAAEHGVAG